MEALRYLPYLNKNGWIITSSSPIKNIPNYPEEETLLAELKSFANVILLDVEKIAKENNMPKCSNVILLGAAAHVLNIITPEQLREGIGRVFAAKGGTIVEMNNKAFDIGFEVAGSKIKAF